MKRVYRISTLIVLIHWIVWIPLNAAQLMCNCNQLTMTEISRYSAAENVVCCKSGEAAQPAPKVIASAGEAETACCDKENSSNPAVSGMHQNWCLDQCLSDKIAVQSPSAKPQTAKELAPMPVVRGGWVFSPQKSLCTKFIPFLKFSHSGVPLFLRHQSFLI